MFFENLFEKIQVSLTSDRNSGYFTRRAIYLFNHTSLGYFTRRAIYLFNHNSLSSSYENCFRHTL